jgi:hypothetical protein
MASIVSDEIELNENIEIIRRIRLDITPHSKYKSELENKSYIEWLRNNSLREANIEYPKENMNISRIKSFSNKEGTIFVTDIVFENQEKFNYYILYQLREMYKNMETTYPFINEKDSPFKYSIQTIYANAKPGSEEKKKFDDLLPPGLQVILRHGDVEKRGRY